MCDFVSAGAMWQVGGGRDIEERECIHVTVTLWHERRDGHLTVCVTSASRREYQRGLRHRAYLLPVARPGTADQASTMIVNAIARTTQTPRLYLLPAPALTATVR